MNTLNKEQAEAIIAEAMRLVRDKSGGKIALVILACPPGGSSFVISNVDDESALKNLKWAVDSIRIKAD
jgi:hypothetical protein